MAVQTDVAIPNDSIITNTAWVVSDEGLTNTPTALITVFSFPIATVTGLVWQDVNGDGNPDPAGPLFRP